VEALYDCHCLLDRCCRTRLGSDGSVHTPCLLLQLLIFLVGTNGANLSFPVVFGLSDEATGTPFTDREFWIIGLVNGTCSEEPEPGETLFYRLSFSSEICSC
jgi:hypothetical protein